METKKKPRLKLWGYCRTGVSGDGGNLDRVVSRKSQRRVVRAKIATEGIKGVECAESTRCGIPTTADIVIESILWAND